MERNLNRWMEEIIKDSKTTIDDKTKQENHFIVMKFSLIELLSDSSIGNVLNKINQHVEKISGIKIM